MAANILFDHFGHRRKDSVLGKEVIRLPKCRTRDQAPLPVSIRHIVELIRPLIEPSPFRSRAISADLQVKLPKIPFFVFCPTLFVSVLSNSDVVSCWPWWRNSLVPRMRWRSFNHWSTGCTLIIQCICGKSISLSWFHYNGFAHYLKEYVRVEFSWQILFIDSLQACTQKDCGRCKAPHPPHPPPPHPVPTHFLRKLFQDHAIINKTATLHP